MIKEDNIESEDCHLIGIEGKNKNVEFCEVMRDKHKRTEWENKIEASNFRDLKNNKKDIVQNSDFLKNIVSKFFLVFKEKFNLKNTVKTCYNEDFFTSCNSNESVSNYDLLVSTLYPSRAIINFPCLENEEVQSLGIGEDENINGKFEADIIMPKMDEFVSLNNNGYGLLFFPFFDNNISEYLNRKGLYIQSIIRLPNSRFPIKKQFKFTEEAANYYEETLHYNYQDPLDEKEALEKYDETLDKKNEYDDSKNIQKYYKKKLGCEILCKKKDNEYEIEYNSVLDFEPCLLIVKKIKSNKIFFSKLNSESDLDLIIKNFKEEKGIHVNEGVWVKYFKDIFSFGWINNPQEYLDEIKNEMKDFLDINIKFKRYLSSELYEDKDDFKNIFNLMITNNKSFSNDKIVINSKITSFDYLKYYFKSIIGQMVAKIVMFKILPITSYNGIDLIDFFNSEDMYKVKWDILLPSIKYQKKHIEDMLKLEEVGDSIKEISDELYKIPIERSGVSEKLIGALDSFHGLTDEDKIKLLLNPGENENIEYKESFGRDAGNKKDRSSILLASIKNIAGFINSNGGTLLVGVNNDCIVSGIERDGFKSDDNLLLWISAKLSDNFGAKIYDLVKYKVVKVDGLNVVRFDCQKGKEKIFVNGEDDGLYVRSSPETKKIKGREMFDYVKSHFKSD